VMHADGTGVKRLTTEPEADDNPSGRHRDQGAVLQLPRPTHQPPATTNPGGAARRPHRAVPAGRPHLRVTPPGPSVHHDAPAGGPQMRTPNLALDDP
jgi:hypothetical protein